MRLCFHFENTSVAFHRENLTGLMRATEVWRMETTQVETHQSVLKVHLDDRRKRNTRFSLRSFAKHLEMSPGQLSSLMNGKKNLTAKQAVKIIEKLNLSEQEALDLMREMHPKLRILSPPPPSTQILSEDEFKLISSWEHFAILSLGKIRDNEATPAWIAAALALDLVTAENAFRRLTRLGLIKIKDGHFRQTTKPLVTTTEIPSAAIREHHRQNLLLAAQKIESVPVEEREFTAITMAVNPRRMEKAKKMIREFKQKVCDELETTNCTEVYTLSIQLFPVTARGGRT